MEKTPWFTGGEKPVHIGVYETQHPFREDWTVYQYWNGKAWGKYCPSPHRAAQAGNFPSSFQHQTWRGLAEKPK